MALQIPERSILHYLSIDHVNDAEIKAKTVEGPLVVLHINEGKHLQVKISPFNAGNKNKESLSFKDRLQYYRKTERSLASKQSFKNNFASDPTAVAEFIATYFSNISHGFETEYNDFVDGFNNMPVTGFEGDLLGFFGSYYLNWTEDSLDELSTGITETLV